MKPLASFGVRGLLQAAPLERRDAASTLGHWEHVPGTTGRAVWSSSHLMCSVCLLSLLQQLRELRA